MMECVKTTKDVKDDIRGECLEGGFEGLHFDRCLHVACGDS